MKKYYISLIVLTIVMILAAFCMMWFKPDFFQIIMTFLPLYFGIITGLMHYAVVKSFYKDPRTFVKNFMGLTVGSLFLHLVLLCIWAFTHIPTAKAFILCFAICYVVYLAFETIALALLIRSKRNE